jgi:hypothetical protein
MATTEMMRTGVFATPEQMKQIADAEAGVAMAGLTAARLGPHRAESREKRMRRLIQAAAVAQGLPDTKGFYGYDTGNGEFITWGKA